LLSTGQKINAWDGFWNGKRMPSRKKSGCALGKYEQLEKKGVRVTLDKRGGGN